MPRRVVDSESEDDDVPLSTRAAEQQPKTSKGKPQGARAPEKDEDGNGVLPKRVARRHGKFAASRLRVQGPGAVGGGNGPVAGRASPPGPSPLHPLPRPSSLL